MTLTDLYYSKGRVCDKGSTHDYIKSYYEHEFGNKRNNCINLLEIGVADGSSIEFWLEWFINGKIYGIDIRHIPEWHLPSVKGASILIGDAYSTDVINNFESEFFDYIIDDGPHTRETQMQVIGLWLPKLKVGGKLIIEDLADIHWQDQFHKEGGINGNAIEYANEFNRGIDWINPLIEESKKYPTSYKIYDLRDNVGRYDDIIFEVTKLSN